LSKFDVLINLKTPEIEYKSL